MKRIRIKQTLSLEERLGEEAQRTRELASRLPGGAEREALLLKARQMETASHLTDWLTSRGLESPK
jgi:hypothetical protein